MNYNNNILSTIGIGLISINKLIIKNSKLDFLNKIIEPKLIYKNPKEIEIQSI